MYNNELPQQTAAVPAGAPSAEGSLGRSIAWTGVAKAVAQVFSWLSTLLVARLLTPGDYGLFGMASLFFWAVQALGEFGIGAAVIRRVDLDRERISHLNGLAVLFGLACAAVVMASAGPLAVFFASPDLFEVVLVTALVFPLTSVRTIPAALLQRELRFKVLGGVDVTQAAISAAALLAFAFLGWGYWALVLSNVIGSALGTLLLLTVRRHPLRFPRAALIGEVATFGREVVASRFGWYAMFNADFAVAGRALGAAPLGNYSLAWSLASLPVEKISLVVTRVALPYLAKVARTGDGLRDHILGMTQALALVTFPAAVGIALVADLVVSVIVGPQWAEAVAPLRVLAIAVPIRSVATIFPQLTTLLGNTRFGMYHAAISAFIMTIGFVVGSRFGPIGIAAAWAVLYPVILCPLVVFSLRAIGCPLTRYLASLGGAIRSVLAMSLTIGLARIAVPDTWPAQGRLLIFVALGVISYLGWLALADRRALEESRRFLTKQDGR